jgi:hypothetical protein
MMLLISQCVRGSLAPTGEGIKPGSFSERKVEITTTIWLLLAESFTLQIPSPVGWGDQGGESVWVATLGT